MKPRLTQQYRGAPAMNWPRKKLTQIVAQSEFNVQANIMRKTSDIIWQDAQHQVLFEILDLLKEPTADRDVLCKLDSYIEYHFALEERYMIKLDFPGREAHVRAHAQFRKEISQLMQTGQAPDAQFRDIIATFLTEWLTRHVFGIDKELEQFILRSPAK
jgi:hemerythrin